MMRIIELSMQVLVRKIEKQMKTIHRFEYALHELSGLDRCVIRQLYAEGKEWESIVNIEDKPISTARVGVIRNRAMMKIAGIISDFEEQDKLNQRLNQE